MPPAKLYKYQPFSEASIDNLAEGRIFFSRPSDFNDPFEFRVRFERRELTLAQRRHLFNEARKTAAEGGILLDEASFDLDSFVSGLVDVQEKAQLGLKNRGVACFSELHDHPLMWAHYAAGHTGFCLEFSGTADIFSKAMPVNYLSAEPSMDAVTLALTDDPVDYLFKLAASKLDCWAYEKEWRCLHAEAGTPYGYDAQDLTGIYFGLRMKEGHKITIGAILRNSPARLFQMVERDGGYGVVAQPVDFSQPDYG